MNVYKKVLYVAGASLLLGSCSLLASERSPLEIRNKAFEQTGSMNKYAFTAVNVEHDYVTHTIPSIP